LEEQELIRGLQNGHEDAFRHLMRHYGDRVHNTVLGMIQDREEAGDITQEVFIEVFRSVSAFRGESRLSTWVYRIAIRKSLDHIKSKKRKKRFGMMIRLGFGQDDAHEVSDFHHPGIALENKESAALLFKAIDGLPENQRTAIVLAKIEGLKQDEVAGIMKLSVGAVESLLSRAKQKLKEELKYLNNTDDDGSGKR